MPEEKRGVRVVIWSTNERTLLQFRNECEREGLTIIDEYQSRYDVRFLLQVLRGKRIFLPCKGEVDIWPHRFVGQLNRRNRKKHEKYQHHETTEMGHYRTK